jgi:hypothetical protein
MEEEQKHIDAFELYLTEIHNGLSKTEAVTKVASEYNCSVSTVWTWKKEFDWDDKEAVRSVEINKGVEEKTNSTIIDNKSNYLSMIHNIFKKYVDEVKAGKRNPLEINSMNDLEKGIKTALLLQGESTDRTESNTTLNANVQFDKNAQKKILEEEGYDAE